MPPLTEAGAALARALEAAAPDAAIEAIASRSWASITFTGERHRLRLRFGGERPAEAARAFAEALPEREFELRGHIVADIAVTARRSERGTVRLTIEALTVEAA